MAGGEETKSAAEAEMDLEFSRGADVPSFEFAFNFEKFSDKVLQIEVVAGDDGGGGRLPDSNEKGTPILTVKALHINSASLAARSPFFLKLFVNGMKESDDQTHPRIRIANSEENALMKLLSYMYSGKLKTTEPTLLLDILMAADKFEVISCMRHCSQLLTSLPMTTESPLLYIDHPCSTSMAAEVQHVIGVAKEFFLNKYKDFEQFEDELMNISLAGIEAIFSSSDILVNCEDVLYYFMLERARARYLDSEERRDILSSRLLPLVRFSHMTRTALEEILSCTDNDVDHDQVTKSITDVLLHKDYPEQMEGDLAAGVTQFAERAYGYKPVKLVAFDGLCPQVIVYLDLMREECSWLFPSEEHRCSRHFRLAGWVFFLMATCEMNEQSRSCTFGLCLGVCEDPKSSRVLTVDIEFAARTRSSGKFVSKWEDKVTFNSANQLEGCDDLFGFPWSTFIADDNLFIDEVLHLRADLRLVVGHPDLQS